MESRDEMKVREMINGLYREDPGHKEMQEQNIERTFSELRKFPEKGTILVIDDSGEVIGYSTLINVWSNEYGGNVLEVDELFVVKNRRGGGISTAFLQWLIKNRFNECVSIELGTTSGNAGARKLYERLGFKLSDQHRFSYEF